MSKKIMARRSGFTLIEAIVVIVIIGIIATLIAPRLFGRIGQSKQSVTKANAAALAGSMKLFILDHGMPEPGSSIDILFHCPPNVDQASWKPYVDNEQDLKDQWGNLFLLRIPGQINVDFDIVSLGADGRDGGEGEDEDIVNGKK
jgi:general secretion pathway protein G